MNTRQVATGTVLTASLLLGGGSLADASPSRPAIDRGRVPCHAVEHRMDNVSHHLQRLAARRDRLEARLAAARADQDGRRVRRLQIQLNQVSRAEARLGRVLDDLDARYRAQCAPVIPE